jgi:hypothetical protein
MSIGAKNSWLEALSGNAAATWRVGRRGSQVSMLSQSLLGSMKITWLLASGTLAFRGGVIRNDQEGLAAGILRGLAIGNHWR